jgi:uncharacterized protein (TIGR02996 family)
MRPEDFLMRINAEPDDDVARLTYADWLSDRGDPRGELIHLQSALESLQYTACKTPLRLRIRRLWIKFADQWTKELRELGVETVKFRGGFPFHIKIDGEAFLKFGREILKQFATIRSVELARAVPRYSEVSDVPELTQLTSLVLESAFRHTDFPAQLERLLDSPFLPNLTRLEIGPKLLNGDGFHVLVNSELLPQLEHLDISSNLIGVNEARQLASIQNDCQLESLNLAFCHLDEESLVELGMSRLLENVCNLDLSHNEIDSDGFAVLNHSPYPRSVRRLRMDGRHISQRLDDRAVEFLANGNKFRDLRCLDLSSQNLTRRAIDVMNSADFVYNLEWLDLSYNSLREQGIKRLSSLPFAELRVLNLKRVDCGDIGATSLATSRWLTQLESLNLSDNRIGEAGVHALSISPIVCNVHTLHLGGNLFEDAGAKHLSSSPYLNKIRVFGLNNVALGSPAIRALGKSTTFQKLEVMDLSNNLIPSSVISTLAESHRMPSLIALDLRDNYTSPSAIAELICSPHFRSDLKIHWERERDRDVYENDSASFLD